VSYSVHTNRCRMFRDELSDVLDIVLAGEIVTDRSVAERLVRWLSVIVRLLEQDPIDEHGRCRVCWAIPRHWWHP
jgi:predicted nicotinamide N-methyase